MTKENFTPAPWIWEVNVKDKNVELCGGGIEVLRFQRWGMQGAAPTFTRKDSIFKLQGEGVEDLLCPIKGKEHHAHWQQTINHPDARLIEQAPVMYGQLEQAEKALRLYGCINMADEIKETLSKVRGE